MVHLMLVKKCPCTVFTSFHTNVLLITVYVTKRIISERFHILRNESLSQEFEDSVFNLDFIWCAIV